jgi:surface protein
MRAENVRAPSAGVDRVRLGSQAFRSASAFNADIGAWNTARVTSLSYVCAAFSARAARHSRRDALGGCSMRRGPLCAAGPPMRAGVGVRSRVGARMRVCPRV